MTAGLKCWDASGDVVFDASFASWFVLREDITLNANASASYSLPEAAGMEVKVIESAYYDPLAIGLGLGTILALWHTVSVDTSAGYPVVTLSVFKDFTLNGATTATPMRVYIFGRYT